MDEFIAFEDLMRQLHAGQVVADDLRRVIDNLGSDLPEEAAWAEDLGELYEAVEECSRFLLATLA